MVGAFPRFRARCAECEERGVQLSEGYSSVARLGEGGVGEMGEDWKRVGMG